MNDLHGHFADAAWGAARIGLSLARGEQRRETESDGPYLRDVADALDRFGAGGFEQPEQFDHPLFSNIEGYLVLTRALRELGGLFTGKTIRRRALRVAAMLKAGRAFAGELRRFFRKAHDIAEEIVALGLHVDPVVEVFTALGEKSVT